MGGFVFDGTVLSAVHLLNERFGPGDPIVEMAALQREFGIFKQGSSLRSAAALLNVAPSHPQERQAWLGFLDRELGGYPSDVANINGHDRVVDAIRENLESAQPLPMHFAMHLQRDDPRVTVTHGTPLAIYKQQIFVIISAPITP